MARKWGKARLPALGLRLSGRMHKKTIRDIDVLGKRVFVRVDFNVPLDDGREIVPLRAQHLAVE